MKKRIFSLLLPIFTLVLEILPYGAVCNFANPEGKPWRETFSYFDLTPFGYANFAPFITAVLTCVIVITGILYFITGRQKIAAITRCILVAASVISLGPLVFGIRYFSVVGALITVSLIAALIIFQHYAQEREI